MVQQLVPVFADRQVSFLWLKIEFYENKILERLYFLLLIKYLLILILY
jgi:hypothetical protein